MSPKTPESPMAHQTGRKRIKQLLTDLCVLSLIPSVVGLIAGIATFSRVTALRPNVDANRPAQTTTLSTEESGESGVRAAKTKADPPPPDSLADLRLSCVKATFAAIALTLFATVPGLLIQMQLQGAAMPLATIAWRIPPTFGGLALAGWWDEPERNCYVAVLLACYFTALVLESGLLVRRLATEGSASHVE